MVTHQTKREFSACAKKWRKYLINAGVGRRRARRVAKRACRANENERERIIDREARRH